MWVRVRVCMGKGGIVFECDELSSKQHTSDSIKNSYNQIRNSTVLVLNSSSV